MTISNWFFGLWGVLNLVALATVYFVTPNYSAASDTTFLIFISVLIPFVQTVFLSLKWHLNFSKYASSDERRLVHRRWWQVFRRTPIASTAMILCIVGACVSQLLCGPGRLHASGGTVSVSGPLMVFLVAFSSITVHTNLIVGRNCQDIVQSPLEPKAAKRRKLSSGRSEGKTIAGDLGQAASQGRWSRRKMSPPAFLHDWSALKGTPFALVGLLFVAASLRGIFVDLQPVFRYQPVKGLVTTFTAPDKAATDDLVDGRIEFTYRFHDATYQGSYPAKGMRVASFSRPLLDLPHAPGDEIEIAVDPGHPAISTADPRLNPFWIAMLIFSLPFAYLGLTIAWKGEGGLDNAFFWPYAMLSAIGTVSVLFAGDYFAWKSLACIGLSLPLAIPLLVKWLARCVGLRRSNRGHGIITHFLREDRRQFLFLSAFSVVWWFAIAAMAYALFSTLSECQAIRQTYQIAQGRVVVSGNKDSSARSSSGRRRIIYEFRVGDTPYKGDRVTVAKEKITKAYLDKYPLNRAVTVYYDPADPNNSVLERGLPDGMFALGAFLVIFVPLGVPRRAGCIQSRPARRGMRVLRRRSSARHRH